VPRFLDGVSWLTINGGQQVAESLDGTQNVDENKAA
jgi:hypothetical protein